MIFGIKSQKERIAYLEDCVKRLTDANEEMRKEMAEMAKKANRPTMLYYSKQPIESPKGAKWFLPEDVAIETVINLLLEKTGLEIADTPATSKSVILKSRATEKQPPKR